MDYNNHLKLGPQEYTHKGKRIVSSINSQQLEIFIENLNTYEYDVGVVPAGYEHRADLISNLFYETPTLDWLICLVNNISDPFQELKIGTVIKIPKLV
jgi:hypothetical protein